MTGFITRSCREAKEYEIIIQTDSMEHYKAAQDFARRLIDHAKPTTNADRIRAMTDEELAKEMRSHAFALAACSEKAWLEWLQQPCGGDGQ